MKKYESDPKGLRALDKRRRFGDREAKFADLRLGESVVSRHRAPKRLKSGFYFPRRIAGLGTNDMLGRKKRSEIDDSLAQFKQLFVLALTDQLPKD